ncbi:glycine cleavage system protein R [Kaarinaea lacus]
MDSNLVITALGKDKPGIVDKLSMAVMDCGCNIEDSRMMVLGGEFAVMLMVTGKWNQLAKLEESLPPLREKLDLTISAARTEGEPSSGNLIPYSIEVVAIDHPGIVYQIASFFSAREINIHELNTNRYAAAHTGTPMFSMNMIVDVPAATRIAALREEFLDFCDELNMDAIIEPMKS